VIAAIRERDKGFEPSTSTLARVRSIRDPLVFGLKPHGGTAQIGRARTFPDPEPGIQPGIPVRRTG
jgi:hypothetical protein